MNKKKSVRLWTIILLKKLLMIHWDMWQFRNKTLHSPTGLISIASHRSLNYQISEGKRIGIDGINQLNFHLFSKHYTIIKFQFSSITYKKFWLDEVRLAHKEYVEPDDAIRRQTISMCNQMQSFLITNGPLIPVTPQKDQLLSRSIVSLMTNSK